MKTSPTHDLMEHAVAGQLGRRRTALAVNSLSRLDAVTNREGDEAGPANVSHWEESVTGRNPTRQRGRTLQGTLNGCVVKRSPSLTRRVTVPYRLPRLKPWSALSDEGCRIGHWLLVVGYWLLNSATAHRWKIAISQRPITNHQFLRFALLIFTSIGVGGCGSDKTSQPTVKPRELSTDAQRLSLVQFSPDGKLLAAGGADGEVLVWRESSAPPTKLESGRSSPLVSLTWSPDGLLAMTDLDRGFVGWQFGEAKPDRVEFPPLASVAVCIAFRPQTSDRELVLGMQDGSLIFVDKNGSKQLKPEHRGPVKQALYSSDGRSLVTAGADGKILWRDASTRQLQQSVKGAETDISRLLLSADGKQLISGDWNGRLKVWDMATRKSLREFEQSEAVSGLGWVRGELVSGSWDGTVRGWEVASGRVLRSFSTGQPIHDLATDSGTSRIATVGLDRSVRVWDWQSATPQ